MPKTLQLADRFEVAASLGATLADTAQAHGIDIGPIAAALGLDVGRFSELSTRVSLDRMCRLFETLSLLSGDPGFGLAAAERFEPGMTGAFGYGILSAPTFRHSVDFAVRHHRVLVDAQRFDLTIVDDNARIEWALPTLIVRHDQFADHLSGLFAARFRDLLGLGARAAHFHLRRPAPAVPGLYRRRLSAHVRFAEPVNAIVFPAHLLDTPNPRADARLFRLMEQQCAALAVPQRFADDIVTALRVHILGRLAEGEITLGEAAHHIGLTPRTLQRRLAEAGTSLNELIDRTRAEVAQRLLRDSERPISDIGYELGFSQPSAFTRSTQRWFGLSPSQLRQHLRRSEADLGPARQQP